MLIWLIALSCFRSTDKLDRLLHQSKLDAAFSTRGGTSLIFFSARTKLELSKSSSGEPQGWWKRCSSQPQAKLEIKFPAFFTKCFWFQHLSPFWAWSQPRKSLPELLRNRLVQARAFVSFCKFRTLGSSLRARAQARSISILNPNDWNETKLYRRTRSNQSEIFDRNLLVTYFKILFLQQCEVVYPR